MPAENLRHVCAQCGGSCQGMRVKILDREKAHIEARAAELGVPQPVEDGRLRMVDGQCVFLNQKNMCRLHAFFGSESKPVLCRQYPLVHVQTDTGPRYGTDPGCLTTMQSWRNAPACATEGLVPMKADLHPQEQETEKVLLQLLSLPDQTVAGLLRTFAGQGPGVGLPSGYAGRLVQRLQATNLPELLGRPDTGRGTRQALQPLTQAIAGWSTDTPPEMPSLEPECNAFALEVAHRLIYLRLTAHLPTLATAVLVLSGAVALSWSDPRPAIFGPGMSAWSRLVRATPFLVGFTPEPDVLRWLLEGDRRLEGS